MNAERLLAQFERISEAPDAIARLRSFILDLAVRGKLVEQDPEDEPAAELLASVALEKVRRSSRESRIAGGLLPNDRNYVEPFSLQTGWEWTTLEDYALDISTGPFGSMLHQSDYIIGGVPVVNPSHMVGGRICLDIKVTVSPSMADQLESYKLASGDIVMARRGEVGRAALVTEEEEGWLCGTGSFIVRFIPEILRAYVLLFLSTDLARGYLISNAIGTTMTNLNHGILKKMPIPLPPLAEQHRIVSKVDELMALCDQLEAARQQRERGRERLVAATLQRLNQLAEDPASFRNDASFALQVLPFLTTTPAQIKQLRQTILNLAVRGKLVEQDPEDEPAVDLLANISFERVDSVKSRTMKSPRPVAPYDGDGEYELPRGWAWSQLGSITAVEDGAMCDGPFGSKLKTEHYIGEPGFAVVRLGNIGIGEFLWGKEGHITREHFESLPGNHIRPGDLLVAGLADPLVRCCEAPANLGPAVNKADCFRLRLHRLINRFFVCQFLNSPVAKSFAAEENHGMTRERINLANAKSIPIPLPPLAEQHRIVAKVDELIALCDQLEQQLNQADQQRRRLLEAVLAEALVEPEKTLETAYA